MTLGRHGVKASRGRSRQPRRRGCGLPPNGISSRSVAPSLRPGGGIPPRSSLARGGARGSCYASTTKWGSSVERVHPPSLMQPRWARRTATVEARRGRARRTPRPGGRCDVRVRSSMSREALAPWVLARSQRRDARAVPPWRRAAWVRRLLRGSLARVEDHVKRPSWRDGDGLGLVARLADGDPPRRLRTRGERGSALEVSQCWR